MYIYIYYVRTCEHRDPNADKSEGAPVDKTLDSM